MKFKLIIILLCFYCAGTYASNCNNYAGPIAENCESVQRSVQIATGSKDSAYLETVADIAQRENDLKVVPMVTKGSRQNIEYLLWLKGVDLALVRADILKDIFDNPSKYNFPENIADKIYLVANVFSEKIYLITSKPGQDVKKIAILGSEESGSYHTYEFFKNYFSDINIDSTNIEEILNLNNRNTAYSQLQHGEIDAAFFVVDKTVKEIRFELDLYLSVDDYNIVELTPNYPLYPIDQEGDTDLNIRTVDALLVAVYVEDQSRRKNICDFNKRVRSLRDELGFNAEDRKNVLRLNKIECR